MRTPKQDVKSKITKLVNKLNLMRLKVDRMEDCTLSYKVDTQFFKLGLEFDNLEFEIFEMNGVDE